MSALAAGLVLSKLDLAAAQDPRRHDPRADFAAPQEAKSEKNFRVTRATFQPHVGSVFVGRGVGGTAINLVLIAVKDRTPKPESKKVTKAARDSDSFSLIFKADGDLTDLTNIHRLDHAVLGEQTLFLTRSTDDKGQIFYEAVFNHMR
jgi:hypothetical protein